MLRSPLFNSRYNHPVVRANRQSGSPLSAVALANRPAQAEATAAPALRLKLALPVL